MMDSGKYTCDDRSVPRPPTGKTPVRNLRVPDDVWRAAQEKAAAEGRSLTEVIVTYLRRYVSTPPRKRAAGTESPAVPVAGGAEEELRN
jgi:hypothetical protein